VSLRRHSYCCTAGEMCEGFVMALFGPRAMSDLSPQCAPQRTYIQCRTSGTNSAQETAAFSRAAAGVKLRSFEVALRKSSSFQAPKGDPMNVCWLTDDPTRALATARRDQRALRPLQRILATGQRFQWRCLFDPSVRHARKCPRNPLKLLCVNRPGSPRFAWGPGPTGGLRSRYYSAAVGAHSCS
jgi:hypothetical protein